MHESVHKKHIGKQLHACSEPQLSCCSLHLALDQNDKIYSSIHVTVLYVCIFIFVRVYTSCGF